MFGYNMIDLIIVIFLGAWVAHGYRKGFLTSIIDLAAFLLALLVATASYPVLSTFAADRIGIPRSYSNLFGFLIILTAAVGLLNTLAWKLHPRIVRFLRGAHLSRTDRLAGVVPTLI